VPFQSDLKILVVQIFGQPLLNITHLLQTHRECPECLPPMVLVTAGKFYNYVLINCYLGVYVVTETRELTRSREMKYRDLIARSNYA